MGNGEMLTEAEEYERISRVMDYCANCETGDICGDYCAEAQEVRDGK